MAVSSSRKRHSTYSSSRPLKRRKLSPGDCLNENLKMYAMKLKGSGAFGTVVQCRDPSHPKPIAVKVFRERADGIFERNLLKQIKSKYVVRYLEQTFQSNRGEFCVALECVDSDLWSKIHKRKRGYGLRKVRRWGKQLLQALADVHSKGIVHGDLKTANILVSKDEETVKLCDFGSSWKINHPPRLTRVGTSSIRSPDVIIGWSFGYATDVWSLACVLFTACMGFQPFYVDPSCPTDQENLVLLRTIISQLGPVEVPDIRSGRRFNNYFLPNGKFKIDLPLPTQSSFIRRVLKMMGFPKISRHLIVFVDLITQMWRYDVEERPTVAECRNHSFFKLRFAADDPIQKTLTT